MICIEIPTVEGWTYYETQIIKNLTDQMSFATNTRSNVRNDFTSHSMRVRQNHYELFEDLSQSLQEQTEGFENTKGILEAWVLGSYISGVTTLIRRNEL